MNPLKSKDPRPPLVVVFRKLKLDKIKREGGFSTGTSTLSQRSLPEVIALFPEVPDSCMNWYTCIAYVHVGQQGGADPAYVMHLSAPCKPSEYADLLTELKQRYEESQGEGDIAFRLVVRKNAGDSRYTKRRKEEFFQITKTD
jgi:hypothetical protein